MADKSKPIPPDKVTVDVTPVEKDPDRGNSGAERRKIREQNDRNRKHADKLKEGLTKEAQKGVEDNAGKGRQAQKDAATAPAERVAKDVPPKTIEKIDVKIDGETITIKPDK